ncbi:prephenate dehydrogenase [Bosea sp. TWI1241]|uniref:prephenate dehydrogenase n=1 Tax=Bosea sp. TWI1241 TaxID=3148904 RepID=UPI0032098EDF
MSLSQKPALGLMGFGAFGRLVARHLQPHLPVLAFDPATTIAADPSGHGLHPATPAEVAACAFVVLAVPVAALPEAIALLAPQLKPGTVVLDVGSVKTGPVAAMQAALPACVEIVATHPLFGPNSACEGIAGLSIALCPVRGTRHRRIAAFLRKVLGLRVILTTPDAHDREAAVVQGLTHLIARILTRMEPLPTRMTTASFSLLMRATDMVRDDSAGVFLAIERANPHARQVRDRFFALAQEIRDHLDGETPAPAAEEGSCRVPAAG